MYRIVVKESECVNPEDTLEEVAEFLLASGMCRHFHFISASRGEGDWVDPILVRPTRPARRPTEAFTAIIREAAKAAKKFPGWRFMVEVGP